MAYTAPTTRTAGEFIDESDWNTDVADNITFLANPPACRVNRTTDQSINDSSGTIVLFTAERFDTASMHSTVSNTGRITFPVAGIYLVEFNGLLQAAADYSEIWFMIRLNGATDIARQMIGTVADSTSNIGLSLSTLYKFAANDYVEVLVFHDNSANAARNVLGSIGNYGAEFSAVWVGLG